MADDQVTKKDLQTLQVNLQAHFNKQIADLKKSIDGHQKFNEDSAKWDESIQKRVEGLEKAVNNHAEVLKALEKFTEGQAKFNESVKQKLD